MSALVLPAQTPSVNNGTPIGAHPGSLKEKQAGAGENSEFASLLHGLAQKKEASTFHGRAQDEIAETETSEATSAKMGAPEGSAVDLEGLFTGALASSGKTTEDNEISQDDEANAPAAKTKRRVDAVAALVAPLLPGFETPAASALPRHDENHTHAGATIAGAAVLRNQATAAIGAVVGQNAVASVGPHSADFSMPSEAGAAAAETPAVVDVQVLGARTYLGLEGVVRRASKIESVPAAGEPADRGAISAGAAPLTAKQAGTAVSPSSAPVQPAGGTAGEPYEQTGKSAAPAAGPSDRAAKNAGAVPSKTEQAATAASAGSTPVQPTEGTSAEHHQQTEKGATPVLADDRQKSSSDAGGLSDVNAFKLDGLGASTSFGSTSIAVDELPKMIADQSATLGTSPSASTIGAGAVKELDVQLNPADLGSLSVKLRLSSGHLAVVIEVSKADTLKLIDSQRDEISDRLASVDHPVASVVVKASDTVKSYGENGNASNSGTALQGDAQSNTANGSQGRARSSRDDSGAQASPTTAADDATPRRNAPDGLFV